MRSQILKLAQRADGKRADRRAFTKANAAHLVDQI
jgi:hypothetical protein